MQYTTTNAVTLQADLLGFVSEEAAAAFFRPLQGVVRLLKEVPTLALGRGMMANRKIQNQIYDVLRSVDWQTLCETEWLVGQGSPAEAIMKTLGDAECMLGEFQALIAGLANNTYKFTTHQSEAGVTSSEILQHELNRIAEQVIDPLEQKLAHAPNRLLKESKSKA